MKFPILVLAAAIFQLTKAESGLTVKRSIQCETVLSNEVCTGLRHAVKYLHLLPSALEKGIEKAIAEGKSTSSDIYKVVVEFFKNEVEGKDCEDFLASQLCTRIRKALTPFNLAKLAGKLAIEAMIKGPPTKYELFLRVMNLIRKEVEGKKCDEVLAVDMCRRLKLIGIKLLIKAGKASKYVIEAAIAGYNNREEIYQAVLQFYKNEVASLTCNRILSDNVCNSLNNFGKIFALPPEEITAAVKEAILKGKVELNDIIDEVKRYISKIAQSKTCEDLLPSTYCSELRQLAAKLKLNFRVLDEAIREAMKTGNVDLQSIKDFCMTYFKERMSCESWLGNKTCSYIRSFASKVGMKIKEVEAIINEVILKNQSKVSEIFQQVINYIKNKIFG